MQSKSTNRAVGVNKTSTVTVKTGDENTPDPAVKTGAEVEVEVEVEVGAEVGGTSNPQGTKVQVLKGVAGGTVMLSYLPGDIAYIMDDNLLTRLLNDGYVKEC